MKQSFLIIILSHLAFFFYLDCASQIKPAQIFSDNMVLQRKIEIPVWGKAAPDEKISLELNSVCTSTFANHSGFWKAYFPEFEAGGPFTLKIVGKADSVFFKNILIGDVWFASGQSNMEHPMEGWEWIPHSEIENYNEEIIDTSYPEIRLFTVPKFPSPVKQNDLIEGEWKNASPESVAEFSSIGWFFAKKLHTDLNIPVGIINSSWGGTSINTWLSRESLELFNDSINLPPVPQNFNPLKWGKKVVASVEKNQIRRTQISYPEEGIAAKINLPNYDNSSWKAINFLSKNNHFENVVWLRKEIVVPESFLGQKLKLSLGFLNRQSQIFFNGKELGYFQYPKSVEVEIQKNLIQSGVNILVIRLAQPFGGAQILGEESNFYITNADSSFHLNIEENWLSNDRLEPVNPVGESFQNNPAYLFNGMVAPIIPYGIKGIIWYQGESDTGRPIIYEKSFQELITDWRKRWNMGELPFLYFQISNIELSHKLEDHNNSWCLLREAQKKALLLPNTGMVVSMDIGDKYDIHPKNKKEFTNRLFLQAKEKVYGKKVVSDGPFAQSYKINNDTLIVTFKTDGELEIKTKNTSTNGFEIAGVDDKYYPANTKIKGNEIFIFSSNVKNPVATKYAWKNNPDCNLYNSFGLPAAPFNTLYLNQLPGK